MEGKEVVTNILQTHDDYINELKGIPLNGITQDEMNKSVPKMNKKVVEVIREMDGVTSVEKWEVASMELNGYW